MIKYSWGQGDFIETPFKKHNIYEEFDFTELAIANVKVKKLTNSGVIKEYSCGSDYMKTILQNFGNL